MRHEEVDTRQGEEVDTWVVGIPETGIFGTTGRNPSPSEVVVKIGALEIDLIGGLRP